MTDVVDDFIESIQAELCRFMRAQSVQIDLGNLSEKTFTAGPAIYYTIGKVAQVGHKAMPCVSWVETGGKTDPSDTTDESPKIFNDTIRLRVVVQGLNKASCRALWINLRNASRAVCGTQLNWGNYEAPSEAKASNCTGTWAIEADADLTLAIPLNPLQVDGFSEPIPYYARRKVTKATDQTLEHME